MKKATVYNQKGEKVGSVSLKPAIFEVKENQDLIQKAVVSQLANARIPVASTKTRALVSGGGKKPWRQKGTGRARAGSIRSPLWRGGGITFGPTRDGNFKKAMPKKMRQKALFIGLSNKAKENKLILLDTLKFSQIKAKKVNEMLEKLPIKEGTVLASDSELDVKFALSSANLPYLKLIKTNALNIFDVLKYDWLILTKEAIKEIEKRI